MSINLQATVWKNDTKEFSWGTVLKCAHPNRRKNEAGDWETVSTDYIDIVIKPEDKEQFSGFILAPVSTRMTVSGKAKFKTFTKSDGSAGISIDVWPEELDFYDNSTTGVMTNQFDPGDAPF